MVMNTKSKTGTSNFATRVVSSLAQRDVSHAFIVPGADVAPLVNAVDNHPEIRTVFATHEISAGAMADGFSRATGRPAMAISVGGPGASYLAASVASGSRDGSCFIAVTGSPPRSENQYIHPTWPNDKAMFRAAGAASFEATTQSWRKTIGKIDRAIDKHRIVHLSMPVDEQTSCVDESHVDQIKTSVANHNFSRFLELLNRESRLVSRGRIVLAVGNAGICCRSNLRELAEQYSIPIITGHLSRGVINERETLALGSLGFMPSLIARRVVDAADPISADLVIAVGAESSLIHSIRNGGVRHLEVSPDNVAELDSALFGLLSRSSDSNWIRDLTSECSRLSAHNPDRSKTTNDQSTHRTVLTDAMEILGPDACHVVDAGQFHLLAPELYTASQPRNLLTGSELVSMGWSVGASIGAKCGRPSSPVVAYLGDGSFCMHGLEISTAARYNIPVLFVVAKNDVLGSVWRGANDPNRQTGKLGPVDIAKIVRACGVDCVETSNRNEYCEAIKDASALTRPRVVVAAVPKCDPAAFDQITGLDWLDKGKTV